MKVWELREGLARMDGDDLVVLRVHAPLASLQRHGRGDVDLVVVKAAELAHLESEYLQLAAGEDDPKTTTPRVRCAVLEAWV